MSRLSPPTGGSLSAEELRRRRDAEEAFERRCARAAKRLERIADPDVLVARLRDLEDERAVPVLLHALGDESPDVPAAAAEAFASA